MELKLLVALLFFATISACQHSRSDIKEADNVVTADPSLIEGKLVDTYLITDMKTLEEVNKKYGKTLCLGAIEPKTKGDHPISMMWTEDFKKFKFSECYKAKNLKRSGIQVSLVGSRFGGDAAVQNFSAMTGNKNQVFIGGGREERGNTYLEKVCTDNISPCELTIDASGSPVFKGVAQRRFK